MKRIYLLWFVLLGLGCQNASKINTAKQKPEPAKDTADQHKITVVFYDDTINSVFG